MTTKQADKLLGQEITVSFPRYNEFDTISIIRRRPRSAIVEAYVKRGGVGVFNCHEMELLATSSDVRHNQEVTENNAINNYHGE